MGICLHPTVSDLSNRRRCCMHDRFSEVTVLSSPCTGLALVTQRRRASLSVHLILPQSLGLAISCRDGRSAELSMSDVWCGLLAKALCAPSIFGNNDARLAMYRTCAGQSALPCFS